MRKQSREVIELLEQDVDVRRLVRKLSFNSDDLDTAVAQQPSLYIGAGTFRAQALLRKLRLKQTLDRVTSERSIKVRHKLGDTTEGAVKVQVLLDPVVRKAQRRLDQANALYEFAEQFTEAWKQRLMAIAILQKIRSSEISSELRSVKSEEELGKLRKKAREARHKFEELEGEND